MRNAFSARKMHLVLHFSVKFPYLYVYYYRKDARTEEEKMRCHKKGIQTLHDFTGLSKGLQMKLLNNLSIHFKGFLYFLGRSLMLLY